MNPLSLSLGGSIPPIGTLTYRHGKKYSYTRSFSTAERICIKFTAPRVLGIDTAVVHCYDDENNVIAVVNGLWVNSYGANDVYKFSLSNTLKPGLYFYTVELSCCCGTLYAHQVANEVHFENTSSNIQLTVSDFKYSAPSDIYGGIIYHIFVDRFAKSGKASKKPGAVIVDDWSEGVPEYPEYPGAFLRNNTFWGGNLWGIIDKLPYISSLGVTAIYLSPIFESASNHKYDTADYMSVDSMFGGDKALRALIKEAKKRGISIILDGVFNHTGSDSMYFNRYGNYGSCGAYQSAESPYYTWYNFTDHPDKYTCWWGIEILPRINPDNPSCREYFVGKDGVIERYARMGIGGIRLDVVDELSDEFVSSIKAALTKYNHSAVLYGEVWEDGSNKIAYGTRKRYYLGSELDGVMNYPLRTGIIEYLCQSKTEKLTYALTDIINNAPKRIRDAQMNLLGTHDTERILTVLGGISSRGKSNAELRVMRMNDTERTNAVARLKAAYTILATLPGIPTIFYGDEAGLEGYGDPFNRMPYPWGNERRDLVEHYQKLGSLRRSSKVYKDSEFALIHLDEKALIFSRAKGKSAYVTVFNNSDDPMEISFTRKFTALINVGGGILYPKNAEVYRTSIDSEILFKFRR